MQNQTTVQVLLMQKASRRAQASVTNRAAVRTDTGTCWQNAASPGGAAAQVPLFPGDCELRQLLHIFKLLGTPTEAEWEGVSQLRDWHEFPNWRKQSLAEHFPALEPAGVDLLDAMFIYDPALRITVRPPPPQLH